MDKNQIEKLYKSIINCKDKTEEKKLYKKVKLLSKSDACNILLKILNTGDKYNVYKASILLTELECTDAISKMKEIRNKLPNQTGLRDYRRDIDKAVSILSRRRDGDNCSCEGYFTQNGYGDYFKPEIEENNGYVIIKERVIHKKEYYSEYFVECNICKRRWLVEDEIGYHFPLYKWKEITNEKKYNKFFN